MLERNSISKLLENNPFINNIYFFDEINSTNCYAKQNKIPPDSLVITNFQKNGRGRFERTWESEKNNNLTFTITKKVNIKHCEQNHIVYYAAYSVYSAVKHSIKSIGFNSKLSGSNIRIKWPNDILINQKKAAGILIESNPVDNYYIIGIGINVNSISFSNDLVNTTTSLQIETKHLFNLNVLLFDIISQLQKNFKYLEEHKLNKIYNLWKKSLKCIGNEVFYLHKSGEKKYGKIKDISQSGNIFIEENGLIKSFNNGEIKLINYG